MDKALCETATWQELETQGWTLIAADCHDSGVQLDTCKLENGRADVAVKGVSRVRGSHLVDEDDGGCLFARK